MADQEQRRADDLRRAKRDVRQLRATRPRAARRRAPTIDDKWYDVLTLDDAGATPAEIKTYLEIRKVFVAQRRVKTAIRTHREGQQKYGRWKKPKNALTPEQASVWLKRLRGTHEPTNATQVMLAFQEEPLIDRKEADASNADLVRWLADQDPRIDVTSSQVRRFFHMVVQEEGLRRHQPAILAMRRAGQANEVIVRWLSQQDPPVRVLPKRVENQFKKIAEEQAKKEKADG